MIILGADEGIFKSKVIPWGRFVVFGTKGGLGTDSFEKKWYEAQNRNLVEEINMFFDPSIPDGLHPNYIAGVDPYKGMYKDQVEISREQLLKHLHEQGKITTSELIHAVKGLAEGSLTAKRFREKFCGEGADKCDDFEEMNRILKRQRDKETPPDTKAAQEHVSKQRRKAGREYMIRSAKEWLNDRIDDDSIRSQSLLDELKNYTPETLRKGKYRNGELVWIKFIIQGLQTIEVPGIVVRGNNDCDNYHGVRVQYLDDSGVREIELHPDRLKRR